MSINCGNKSTLGAHTHETVEEAKACFGGMVKEVQVKDLTDLLATPASQPKTTVAWEARELVLKTKNITKDVNPNAGSLRLDVKFEAEGLKRPVYMSLSFTGRTLVQIDKLVCKFTGKLLTDTIADREITIGDYLAAMEDILSMPFKAFVIQGQDGFLHPPIMGSQGRVLWNKVS